MKRALAISGLTSLLGLALLAGCVTVNVYFPEAQAQQAADKIIDAVTGSTAAPPARGPQSKSQDSPGAEPPSSDARATVRPASVLLAATGRMLQLLVPAASAQERADLDISTPEIRAIVASMHQRFRQLQPFFASGAVGVTAEGTIAVRAAGAVPLVQRAALLRLIAQQNQDLTLLYGEVAKANGHPEWAPDIRNVFAQRWMAHARKSGWYYRDGGGNWQHN
ncbi:MAG TPA: DUF1318 domain-containing protein [Steroidobacteraceae bacterium]|jgi:uncharacterized protein YdbL (DUF1318 family)|nr:DUF1318 domain-containing protein [Steroidobacteraceae bacterium]